MQMRGHSNFLIESIARIDFQSDKRHCNALLLICIYKAYYGMVYAYACPLYSVFSTGDSLKLKLGLFGIIITI